MGHMCNPPRGSPRKFAFQRVFTWRVLRASAGLCGCSMGFSERLLPEEGSAGLCRVLRMFHGILREASPSSGAACGYRSAVFWPEEGGNDGQITQGEWGTSRDREVEVGSESRTGTATCGSQREVFSISMCFAVALLSHSGILVNTPTWRSFSLHPQARGIVADKAQRLSLCWCFSGERFSRCHHHVQKDCQSGAHQAYEEGRFLHALLLQKQLSLCLLWFAHSCCAHTKDIAGTLGGRIPFVPLVVRYPVHFLRLNR